MDLIVRCARLRESLYHTHEAYKNLVDIGISEGKIVQIKPKIDLSGKNEIDAEGRLVIPPFCDPHIHLDAVLTAGQPRYNQSGTLLEGIKIWAEYKEQLSFDDVYRRAQKTVEWLVSQGTLHVRTHVDICDEDLIALRALLQLREDLKESINIQIVAFPQEGVVCYPGGAGLLEEALRLGADCVGAIPHYEWTREDGIKELEQVFELAQKHGRMVDVHCDETDDESSRFLEHVAALTVKYSMQGRVVAGHTTAMHSYNNAYAFKLIRQLARSGISIVTNPLDNSVLQGRFDTYPKRRGLTRVKELLEAGVNVAIGHDSVVDPWYPLGRGQILQAAFVLFHMCQMSGRSEQQAIIDMVTKGGSVAMALDEYGIEVGKQADMLIMDVEDEFDLLRLLPLPRWVVKAGRVIAETRPAQTYVNMQSSVTNGLAEKQTTYRAIDFRCREEK